MKVILWSFVLDDYRFTTGPSFTLPSAVFSLSLPPISSAGLSICPVDFLNEFWRLGCNRSLLGSVLWVRALSSFLSYFADLSEDALHDDWLSLLSIITSFSICLSCFFIYSNLACNFPNMNSFNSSIRRLEPSSPSNSLLCRSINSTC